VAERTPKTGDYTLVGFGEDVVPWGAGRETFEVIEVGGKGTGQARVWLVYTGITVGTARLTDTIYCYLSLRTDT
jgi:hypothetical protein